MSTQADQQVQTESAPDDAVEQQQRDGVATDEEKQLFFEVVLSDPAICNNCFAPREYEWRHFRSSGGRPTGGHKGDDRTADRFCTECAAGTGETSLYRPHEGEKILHRDEDGDVVDVEITSESGTLVDYSNVHSELTARFIRDMGGTVERTWSEDDPLPLNGEQVSFFRCLCRLRDRLEEKGYDIEWEKMKLSAAKLKDEHPRQDAEIFARLLCGQLDDDIIAGVIE